MYELSLTYVDGKNGNRREQGFNRSCADFVDEEGLVLTDLLEEAVLKLHRSLDADKKDN